MAQLHLYDDTIPTPRWRPVTPADLGGGNSAAAAGGGWVVATNGDLINPDSAASTQVDENTSTGVTTITISYGGSTYVQTITATTPATGVNRKTVSGWVKQ